MVFPDVEFQDVDEVLLAAEKIDTLSCILGKVIFEYPEPVFRTEHDVEFAFI
jgi:hypothetical protein